MAATYTLISSQTLGGASSSITFSSIPSTYTDLVLRCSTRVSIAGPGSTLGLRFNGDSSTLYSFRYIEGQGSSGTATSSGATQNAIRGFVSDANAATANTFGFIEIYIPSYTSTTNKQISISYATENNATASVYQGIDAGLYRNSSAISSINLFDVNGTNFMTNSSFYLYGIKNS